MPTRRLLALLLILGSPPGYADTTHRYSLSTGLFVSEGDYGHHDGHGDENDTQMRYVPLTFKYRQGPWTARLQSSLIRISGPGNVSDGLVKADAQETASGVGDTILGLDHAWLQGQWLIEPGFRLKLPTADKDEGLGTGSRDTSAQLGITGLFRQWRPFLITGYKWRGSSPLIALDDGAYANAGLDHPLGKTVSTGLGYDWREASVRGKSPVRELFGYASWQMDPRWKLMTYAAKGLSDSSADQTLGLQVSYRW
jgi:hypothetical protein